VGALAAMTSRLAKGAYGKCKRNGFSLIVKRPFSGDIYYCP